MNYSRIIAALAVTMAICSAASGKAPKQRGEAYTHAVIVIGDHATVPQKHAAGELAKDLGRVAGITPAIIAESEYKAGEPTNKGTALFVVGTAETNSMIDELASAGEISVSAADPGPEAYIIRSLPESDTIVIAGCDDRGTLYGVYKYSELYLGVDPMEYWTGKEPARLMGITIPGIDIRAKPPAFPLRGYFDNDSDMLANFKGRKLIIEFDLWKEMIDSCARLGYNFIDPFDTLGRTEFWVWDYYTERFPGYKTDLDLVNRVIDYAHEKGMMVQVSTYLGYEFYHLPYEKNCLSVYHDDWMAAYRHLLEETPIGKADIIYQSPRDPWWDRPYVCVPELMVGISPTKLHERVFNELYAMVKEHNPDAVMIGLLWSDGKMHWRGSGLDIDKDIMMVWSDDGYGRYPSWPEDFRGHDFGIYIHAGFWKNHVMQDPYPARIKDSTLEAKRRGLDGYYFVNGQDFKHFILNLEAAGRAAWDPEGFDPEAYYVEWTTRYFGAEASPKVVESFKALHRASDLAGGFTTHQLQNRIVLEAGRFGLAYCKDRSYLEPALAEARESLELAAEARELVPDHALNVYDDQVLFPARIYLASLELHEAVAKTADARCALLNPIASPGRKAEALRERKELKKDAPERLRKLVDLLDAGSGWDKWEGWTRVENFRKYQPPPTEEELRAGLRFF